jgi:hypothetical protein
VNGKMATCDGHLDEETINLFLDGALDQTARKRAEIHLAECEECLAELVRWHTMFVALDSLSPASANAHSQEQARCQRAVTLTPSGSRWLTHRVYWALPVAQAIASAALLLWMWSRLVGWVENGVNWLVDRFSDSARWMELLWDVFLRLTGRLGEGLSSFWEGTSPEMPVGLSILQGGILVGALLILWFVGNRLLLQDGLR